MLLLIYKKIKDWGSCFLYGRCTTYKINEYILPQIGGGPLAVFDTLENAKRLCLESSIHKIFKCQYKQSKHKTLWFLSGKKKIKTTNRLPTGTKFADAVKLLEEI